MIPPLVNELALGRDDEGISEWWIRSARELYSRDLFGIYSRFSDLTTETTEQASYWPLITGQ